MLQPLPYIPDFAARLRATAQPAQRAAWLRLAPGRQELFAALPQRMAATPELEPELGLDEKTITPAALASLPFRGGWLGYRAYDAGAPSPQHAPLPAACFGLYRQFVLIDHARQHILAVSLPGSEAQTQEWQDLLARAQAGPPTCADFSLTQTFQALTSAERYHSDFARIQHYLQAGDCYQVNYAQAFQARCHGSSATAMQRLLSLSDPAYAAWLSLPEGDILSLSPELFLRVENGLITTKPIKGTAPRAADTTTDTALRQALASSTKNRAENLMIVDLLRHDLGRHAETGSVRVRELFAVETLPQVHHLVSTIEARLRSDSTTPALLADAFPGGSITGAPKKRAMEIIAELEPTPRSIYCGSIGFMNLDGDCQFNIAIRTLLRQGDCLTTWAGGGIVADSECDAEYQECFHKMGAMMRALEEM